jgi:hypothetical protein
LQIAGRTEKIVVERRAPSGLRARCSRERILLQIEDTRDAMVVAYMDQDFLRTLVVAVLQGRNLIEQNDFARGAVQ